MHAGSISSCESGGGDGSITAVELFSTSSGGASALLHALLNVRLLKPLSYAEARGSKPRGEVEKLLLKLAQPIEPVTMQCEGGG